MAQPAPHKKKVIRKSLAKAAPAKAMPASSGKAEVRIFLSYSHKDESSRIKLETHLAQLKRDDVAIWFDGDLNAGDALEAGIARELRRAHVFVALVSPDYLASSYCWDVEYKRAMGRRAKGTIRVVAVLLRPCDWRNTRAADFKLLPKDGRPVSEWRPADKAYLEAANGIRAVVKSLRAQWSAAGAGTVPVTRKPTSTKPTATVTKAQKAVSEIQRFLQSTQGAQSAVEVIRFDRAGKVHIPEQRESPILALSGFRQAIILT